MDFNLFYYKHWWILTTYQSSNLQNNHSPVYQSTIWFLSVRGWLLIYFAVCTGYSLSSGARSMITGTAGPQVGNDRIRAGWREPENWPGTNLGRRQRS